jgi:hypothetical protein
MIMDSIPQPNAGIIYNARVHDDTSIAVLIASVHGIDTDDPQSVRFTIDDGELAPYSRDLGSGSIRVVDVETGSGLNLLWVVYDRLLETDLPMAYSFDADIHLTVEVVDIVGNVLPPADFEFRIESEEEHNLALSNLPEYTFVEPSDSNAGHDSAIEIVSGDLQGARIEYNSSEPLTPIFGPVNEIEAVTASWTEDVGLPLNLMPHTVFDTPVKVFLPLPEDFNITDVTIFYNNGVEWQPACDEDGNLLPGGQGWMVPGSRVNHPQASPPLIEFQVYHFSAAQGGVIVVKSGDSDDSGGTKAVVSCFIDTAADNANSARGLLAALCVLGMLGLLLLITLYLRF